MAYSEILAERIRTHLHSRSLQVEEKKMFGGLAFLFGSKMCCGVVKDDLMVRVVEARSEEALARRGSRVMDFTGRPMKGFLFVSPEGFETEKELADWLDLGVEFVQNAPPLADKPKKKKP